MQTSMPTTEVVRLTRVPTCGMRYIKSNPWHLQHTQWHSSSDKHGSVGVKTAKRQPTNVFTPAYMETLALFIFPQPSSAVVTSTLGSSQMRKHGFMSYFNWWPSVHGKEWPMVLGGSAGCL